MQTLESLRRRISTTQDLRSIVSTMKSMSAVTIAQYEKASDALEEYNGNVEKGIQALFLGRKTPVPSVGEDDRHTIAVIFGTDQGLVGRFNKEIVRHADEFLGRLKLSPDDVTYVTMGRRVGAQLQAEDKNPADIFPQPGSAKALSAIARGMLIKIEEIYTLKGGARVVLFYNRKKEPSLAVPQTDRLLPLKGDYLDDVTGRDWPTNQIPYHSMSAHDLFSALVRERFFSMVCRACAESLASEHATRLATMQAAEKNIDEHLEEMNKIYQQRRQASITEELLDVIAGCESVNETEAAAEADEEDDPYQELFKLLGEREDAA